MPKMPCFCIVISAFVVTEGLALSKFDNKHGANMIVNNYCDILLWNFSGCVHKWLWKLHPCNKLLYIWSIIIIGHKRA